tara:strand:+ start:1493 stop:1954 length:462 start_codon:yes stop_codon:yes gene_type:complete
MNELAIPTKISESQPKPTKAQLVDALFQQAKANYQEEEDRKKKLREDLDTEGKQYAIEVLKKKPNPFANAEVNVNYRYNNDQISIILTVQDTKVDKLCKKLKDLGHSYFDGVGVKKEIRESLKGPNPLLGSQHKQALKDLLDQIMGKGKAIEV